jgi:deoxyribodipyrimidine photo-lyase
VFHSLDISLALFTNTIKSIHDSPRIHLTITTRTMPSENLLIYLLRRDLRLEDNPIFHNIATESASKFTHLLPVYVFPAEQIETCGFVPKDSEKKSPYPEARSKVGRFLRCGPHRARWIAESVWDLKQVLEGVGSGLEIRVGVVGDALSHLLEGFEAEQEDGKMTIGGVWMTNEEGAEEKEQEEDVRSICQNRGVEFKLWKDEKYFIDE